MSSAVEFWRNSDGTIHYRDYISSQEWRRFREGYFKRHPHARCSQCGRGNTEHRNTFGTRLHLHHLNYRNLGCEQDDDIEPICKVCHDAEHSGESSRERFAAQISEPASPKKNACGGRVFQCDAEDPNVYWGAALEAIASWRTELLLAENDEMVWVELKRLAELEDFARFCLFEGAN